MPSNPKHLQELYALIASIDSTEEAETLLQDLLTPSEVESLAERWQEIQMLAAGMTQRDVAKKLGISISKVTRGSRMLRYGTGGFQYFLKKMKKPMKMKI